MFHKKALVPVNDAIFLATPQLAKDCAKLEAWSGCLLSASQCLFWDYGLRL